MIYSHSGILPSNENTHKEIADALDVMYVFLKHNGKKKKPNIDKYMISDRKRQPQQDTNCSQVVRPILPKKKKKEQQAYS